LPRATWYSWMASAPRSRTARVLPSADRAISVNPSAGGVIRRSSLPADGSHTRMVPSAPVDTRTFPSADSAMPDTWPKPAIGPLPSSAGSPTGRWKRVKWRISRPVATSQCRALPSCATVSSCFPPATKATKVTMWPCRQRTVPSRARAPRGSGSPWRSVPAADGLPPATAGVVAGGRAFIARQVISPRPAKARPSASTAASLAWLTAWLESTACARVATRAGTALREPAASAVAVASVWTSSTAGIVAPAAALAMRMPIGAADTTTPRRASPRRSRSSARPRCRATDPAGRPISRAAWTCVLPSR
jgi:hypothetical protein